MAASEYRTIKNLAITILIVVLVAAGATFANAALAQAARNRDEERWATEEKKWEAQANIDFELGQIATEIVDAKLRAKMQKEIQKSQDAITSRN